MNVQWECFLVERIPGSQPPARWRRVGSKTAVGWSHAELPPGAMWEAPWMGDHYRVNGDGPVLVVKLPNGGEWLPGSGANNCTRRGEDHDCWCVHGEAPVLTADKTPEPGRSTCEAGAGSIGSGEQGTDRYWHGFLRDGKLVLA